MAVALAPVQVQAPAHVLREAGHAAPAVRQAQFAEAGHHVRVRLPGDPAGAWILLMLSGC